LTFYRRSTTAGGLSAFAVFLLILVASPAAAVIEYSDGQRETIIELIDQLEERHYAGLRYGDQLSAQHLDSYIESLDRGRMFFRASDIAEFEQYRLVMDDHLRKGNLDAGFAIFNRFQQRLEARLEQLIESLPQKIETLDFTRDEAYETDGENRAWATTPEELDERWRKQIKNQVLSLRRTEKAEAEIAETLVRRYTNQLNRVRQ